jgi:hypothetical protein
MGCEDLKPEQHAALESQVSAILDYYHRLLGRLDERRFSRDGEMFQRALEALKATHQLWEHIHFNHPQAKPGEHGRELPF